MHVAFNSRMEDNMVDLGRSSADLSKRYEDEGADSGNLVKLGEEAGDADQAGQNGAHNGRSSERSVPELFATPPAMKPRLSKGVIKRMQREAFLARIRAKAAAKASQVDKGDQTLQDGEQNQPPRHETQSETSTVDLDSTKASQVDHAPRRPTSVLPLAKRTVQRCQVHTITTRSGLGL